LLSGLERIRRIVAAAARPADALRLSVGVCHIACALTPNASRHKLLVFAVCPGGVCDVWISSRRLAARIVEGAWALASLYRWHAQRGTGREIKVSFPRPNGAVANDVECESRIIRMFRLKVIA